MIRYQMQCNSDHLFDGWFSNSAAFDAQADAGQIECPVCGSHYVRKAMMAPNISPRTKLKGDQPAGPAPDFQNPQPGNAGSGPTAPESCVTTVDAPVSASQASGPEQSGSASIDESFAMMREISNAMRQLRQEVEKNAEYVGPRFAEEARKIHYEEAEPRGIYGEASKEDIEELNDEGVEFMSLPALREDNN